MRFKNTILVLILLSLSLFISAQTLLQGTVTESSGETLIGVNVKIKGLSKGTVTDSNGKFSLSVPGSNSVLVFSYIGYDLQEIGKPDLTEVLAEFVKKYKIK